MFQSMKGPSHGWGKFSIGGAFRANTITSNNIYIATTSTKTNTKTTPNWCNRWGNSRWGGTIIFLVGFFCFFSKKTRSEDTGISKLKDEPQIFQLEDKSQTLELDGKPQMQLSASR